MYAIRSYYERDEDQEPAGQHRLHQGGDEDQIALFQQGQAAAFPQ